MAQLSTIQSVPKFDKVKSEDKIFNIKGDVIFLLQHCASKSNIHGINHFTSAKTIERRILWLSIGISVSIGFIFNLFFLFEKFFQSPVLTDYHHEALPFHYPDISFCITNPIYFPPAQSQRYQKLVDLFRKYKKFKKTKTFIARKVFLADYLYMNSEDIYSRSAWNTIMYCNFKNVECNYSHFEINRIFPYGNCFTFNISKLLSESNHQKDNNFYMNANNVDLSFILYKSSYSPKYYRIDSLNSIFLPTGVMVMIHDKDSFLFPGDSFVVDNYAQFNIKIAQKSHLFSKNKCDPNINYFEYIDPFTNLSKTYKGRRSDCMSNIVQKMITKYCQCQWPNWPRLAINQHLPYCLDSSRFTYRFINKCLSKAFPKITRSYLKSKCLTDKCRHHTYDIVVSHSSFPAISERKTHILWTSRLKLMEKMEWQHFNASDIFKLSFAVDKAAKLGIRSVKEVFEKRRFDLLNEDFVNNNFVQLKFVPGSLYMDKIVETKEYPLSRLLGDIGGCVGLWVGASLITLFEFLDFVSQMWRLFSYRKYQTTIYKKYLNKMEQK